MIIPFFLFELFPLLSYKKQQNVFHDGNKIMHSFHECGEKVLS